MFLGCGRRAEYLRKPPAASCITYCQLVRIIMLSINYHINSYHTLSTVSLLLNVNYGLNFSFLKCHLGFPRLTPDPSTETRLTCDSKSHVVVTFSLFHLSMFIHSFSWHNLYLWDHLFHTQTWGQFRLSKQPKQTCLWTVSLQKTHTDTARTRTQKKPSIWPGLQVGTFWIWGDRR